MTQDEEHSPTPAPALAPIEAHGSDAAETPASPTPSQGGAESSAVPPLRRNDSRRFADQHDMLSDDAGDHRVEGHDDADRLRASVEWGREVSATRIGGELRRIEAEVRRLLEGNDPKRKRKMAGTRRWQELEEDIIAWRFSDRIDDRILVQLRALVTRRHQLFARLRFLASTRPTWNS